MIKKYAKPENVVLIGAVLLRIAYFLINLAVNPGLLHPQNDPKVYLQLAQGLRQGDFLNPEFLYASPLYPLIVALCPGPIPLLLLQLTLGGVTTYIVMRLAQRFFPTVSAIGAIAGVLFTLFGQLLFYETKIYPTSLTIFATLWAVWWMPTRPLLGAAAWTLAIGLTPNVLFFPFLWLAFDRGLTTNQRWRGLLATFLGIIFLASALTLRNYQIDHSLLIFGGNSGINLAQGHIAEANGSYTTLPGTDGTKQNQQSQARQVAENAAGRSLTWKQVDLYWKEQAWAQIAADPQREATLMIRKLKLFFSDSEISHDIDFNYERFLIAKVLPLMHGLAVPASAIFLLAFVALLLPGRWPTCVAAALVTFLLMNVGFYVTERFRLPALAWLIFPAAATLAELKHRPWARYATLAATITTLLAVTTPISPAIRRVGDFNLSLAYEESGDLKTATAMAARLYQERPNGRVAHLLARLYLKAGEIGTAQSHLKAALARPELQNQSLLWNDLGVVYKRSGDLRQAIAAFTEALRQPQSDPLALRNLAQIHADRGEIVAAIDLLQQYTARSPKDWLGWYLLGQALLKQDGLDNLALHTAKRAYQQARTSEERGETAILLGLVTEKAGQWAQAREHYENALRLLPNSPYPPLNLGLLLRDHLGDQSGSQSYFKLAKERGLK